MENREKIDPLNYAVIFFSVLTISSLVADTFFKLPGEISQVIHHLDLVISMFFLFEFSIRFYRAENKLAFMKWG